MGRTHHRKKREPRASRLDAARYGNAPASSRKRAVLLQSARAFPNGWGYVFGDGSVLVLNPRAMFEGETWRFRTFRDEEAARAELGKLGLVLPDAPPRAW